MTAAEHIDYAERILEQLRTGDMGGDAMMSLALAQEAQAHALIAVADVLGVAHTPGRPGGAVSENP